MYPDSGKYAVMVEGEGGFRTVGGLRIVEPLGRPSEVLEY